MTSDYPVAANAIGPAYITEVYHVDGNMVQKDYCKFSDLISEINVVQCHWSDMSITRRELPSHCTVDTRIVSTAGS